MAWNDPAWDQKTASTTPRAIDVNRVGAAIDAGRENMDAVIDAGASSLQSRIQRQQATSTYNGEFEPAEFAMNSKTGEIQLPNGSIVKGDAPTILQLATLQSKDGSALPKMAKVAPGFRPLSHSQLKTMVNAIGTESDFWGEAWANGKSTVGLAASAIDAMFGNDDPGNAWSDAAGDYEKQQSIGELKGSRGRWYSSFDSFLSGLGQTTGNVAGTLVAAAPVAAAGAGIGAMTGAGVGAIPGGALGAGLALSGGASAFGEQATDFYDTALETMSQMDPDVLRSESPAYAQVLKDKPGISHEEAMKEVAILGARAAGSTAGLLGAVEGVIGGRLAGNFLARMGVTKALLGPGMARIAKNTGLGATTARVAGRTVVGGALAGLEEVAETSLGQASGAQRTGIGSTDVMSYASADEFWAATLGGGIFGGLGGRGRADPVEAARESGLAEALGASPDLDQPWLKPNAATEDQDLIPAHLRRMAPKASPGAVEGLLGPAPVPEEQRAQVEQQLNSVLAERFGPDWFNRIDEVSQDPGGRQLVGQLMGLHREAAMDGEQPAYQRGFAQPPVDPGQAPAQGALPMDMQGVSLRPPEQQAPMDPGAPPLDLQQQALPFEQAPIEQPPIEEGPSGQTELGFEPPRQDLRARRAEQVRQQEEMAALSAANPQALPQSESRSVEQEIFALEDELIDVQAALAARPPRDPRRKYLRAELDRVKGALAAAEEAWVAQREAEGPQGVAPGLAVVDSPEPLEAGAERTPDGRPVGVTPPALENPDPMSPEEAAAREQTQAQRRAEAGAAPAPAAAVQAAAAVSEEGVAASTPEPAEDIVAQVDAMMDPASDRDAVFVADGTRGGETFNGGRGVPDGAIEVYRKGVGTLITTNQKKAQTFRSKKLTDAVMQQILGYSEDKAAVIANGEEPVVVQAKRGKAVQAEQIATPAGVPAAAAAVTRQSSKGAQVVATSVAKAQAERASRAEPVKLGPKGEAARTRSKERNAPAPKKPVKKAKSDDERTEAPPSKQDLDDRTMADRVAPADVKSQAASRSTADVVGIAATRKPAQVTVKNKPVDLPTSMTRRVGNRGAGVDLRIDAIDEDARLAVGRLLDAGVLSPADRALAEQAQRDFDQLESMLGAAVTAAEDRLRTVVEASPDGAEFLREAEKRQLEVEQAASSGDRGRPRTKPRTSPLAYTPLVLSETKGFLQALRTEAKAELAAGYRQASSVVRQMFSSLGPVEASYFDTAAGATKALQTLAGLTDASIDEILHGTHMKVKDSTVAKQVMRGASEVAHAIRRMEQDLSGGTQSFTLPSFGNHDVPGVAAKKQPHATEHGTIPAAAQGLVNQWVADFERGGNKFSAPVHVMSMKDMVRTFPGAFVAGRRTPTGKYLQRVDANGAVTDYVLAVDWNAFENEAVAVEVLAHEFGHMVTVETFKRSTPGAQREIIRAYEGWRARQHGRSIDDVMRDQMTLAERAEFRGGVTNRAYAEDFWEWAARNAALYVMDPKRETGSRVAQFFKAVADALRSLVAKVTGQPEPHPAWEEMLDRWVRGTMEVRPMPQLPEATFNHDPLGPDAPTLSTTLTRKATSALAPMRDLMQGKATVGDVTAAMKPDLEGKAIDVLKTAGLSLMTMRQIERQYRDTPLGKPLSGWVRNQQLKAQTSNRALETGSKWMELAQQLDSNVRTVFERVMYEATTFAVHPDLPFTDVKNAHLSRGSDYVKQVNEKRYIGTRALYLAAVKADPRVVDIYAGMRDAFTEIHDKTLQRQLDTIENSNFSEKAKEQIVARIKAAQRELREGPYFPKMRFGSWIVKVQMPAYVVGQKGEVDGASFDSKTAARDELRNQRALNPGAQISVEAISGEPGKYWLRVFQRGVYFFESESEAKAASADIEKEVREQYDANGVAFDDAQAAMEPLDDGDGSGDSNLIISAPFKAREDYAITKQSSPEFMAEVRSLVNERKLDPEVAATLERLAIESLPENNYRQSLLPRQNVLGASKQMLRAYAHRFQGAAHHYAVVEHGKEINKNWQAAWEVNRTYSPAGRVLNVLAGAQTMAANRTKATKGNMVMNAITDASSMFSLAFSPAYVLMNSLQPWMITLPVLAGHVNPAGRPVGMARSGKYLKAAYEGAMPFFTKRGFEDFINESKALAGKRGTNATLQESAKDIITRFGKTAEEQAMLESLLERGTLDFSWLNSLEDAMRGGVVGQKWAALQRLGMALPQQVEAMNRVTTALASYRLAKDEKLTDGSEASLREFADDTVAATQLDYSRMNRPLAFNIPGLNVILQFKLYMQGMYMLFARNAALALKGATPEERKQGKRTIAYLFASHAAAAGAAGLGPAAAIAKMGLVAFAMVAGDDEDDFKSGEQLMREMLQDNFGEYAGTVLERGLPAMLGIDMSDRLGIPVLADERFANIREGDPTGTQMDKWVLYSLGAPYSNFKRLVTGVGDAATGDFAAAINGLPTGARSIARSVKWAKEGVVDRDGDTFVPRDQLDWGDLGISALGLSPLKTSVAYTERTELKGTTAKIINERKALLQEYRTAEVDERDGPREKVAEFNARVPRPFRISGDTLKESVAAKKDRDRGALPKTEAAVQEMLD